MSRARSVADLGNQNVLDLNANDGTLKVGAGVTIENTGEVQFAGIVTAATVQVGAATTLHSTGLDLGSGTLTCHNITSTGVLTYEDVTSVDSIGIITARSGIDVGTGTSISSPSSNVLTLGTSGSEKLRIDSSGRLMLGTTTEGVGDASDLTIANSVRAGLTLRSASTEFGTIAFSDATSGIAEYDGVIAYEHNNQAMRFSTASTEQMRIDSSGRMLIGALSSANVTRLGQALAVVTTSDFGGASLTGFTGSTNYEGPIIDIQRSRGTTTVGTAVATNDRLGSIVFRGDDGTDFADAAYILGEVDGTPSGGFVPGRFTFNTGTGSAAPTERMRIDSSGTLQISMGGSGYATLFRYGTNEDNYIRSGVSGFTVFGDHNGGERMRIDSAGRVLLGTTTVGAAAGDNLTIEDSSNAGITIRSSAVGAGSILFEDTASDRGEIQYSHNGDFMRFKTAGTERLRIDSNGKIYIGPYKAPATYGTPAHNIPYKIGVAPYGWQNGSDLAEISMGNHSGSTGNDDGEIMFKTASNVHSSATGLQNRMQITSTGDTLFYGDAVQYAPNAFYIQTHTITSSWTSYQTIATGLSSNTIYLVSINWQHGSSANQPYYYATSFLFHTANGTNGSSGENEKTFLHTTHTGTTSYVMTFRGLATAGGGSTGHKLQAKINSNWPGATSGNNLKLALTKVMNGTRSF